MILIVTETDQQAFDPHGADRHRERKNKMKNTHELVVVPETGTSTAMTTVPTTATVPTTTNDERTSCRDVLDPASGRTLSNVKLG